MLDLARYGDFDVIAHFDYPARYVRVPSGQAYDIREFEDGIRPILHFFFNVWWSFDLFTLVLVGWVCCVFLFPS